MVVVTSTTQVFMIKVKRNESIKAQKSRIPPEQENAMFDEFSQIGLSRAVQIDY